MCIPTCCLQPSKLPNRCGRRRCSLLRRCCPVYPSVVPGVRVAIPFGVCTSTMSHGLLFNPHPLHAHSRSVMFIRAIRRNWAKHMSYPLVEGGSISARRTGGQLLPSHLRMVGSRQAPSSPSHSFQPRLFLVVFIPITSQLNVGYFPPAFDFACALGSSPRAEQRRDKGSKNKTFGSKTKNRFTRKTKRKKEATAF